MMGKAIEYEQLRTKERVFKGLVARVLEKKKMEYISNKHQLHANAKNVMRRWRKATGFERFVRFISKHTKKNAFESIGRVS